MVGSLKMNTTLEYSTRVVQEGDRRCKKSTLNDLAYLTPLRIPLMNPVLHKSFSHHNKGSPVYMPIAQLQLLGKIVRLLGNYIVNMIRYM
jgi:hypothetical protein